MNAQIGIRIRRLREAQHETREGLAEKADISAKFLYEIETGKKGFSAEILCRLSQALSVSCDYIMLGRNVRTKAYTVVLIVENIENFV